MTTLRDKKAGDTVCVVRYGYGRPGDTRVDEETILKVGRKWAYLDRDRFDRDDGTIDGRGYSSPGNVFVDRETYEHIAQRAKLWEAFKKEVRDSWNRPEHLDIEDIRRMRAIFQGVPYVPLNTGTRARKP